MLMLMIEGLPAAEPRTSHKVTPRLARDVEHNQCKEASVLVSCWAGVASSQTARTDNAPRRSHSGPESTRHNHRASTVLTLSFFTLTQTALAAGFATSAAPVTSARNLFRDPTLEHPLQDDPRAASQILTAPARPVSPTPALHPPRSCRPSPGTESESASAGIPIAFRPARHSPAM